MAVPASPTTTQTPVTGPATEPHPHGAGGMALAAGGLTLLAGLVVVPGPSVADAGAATWAPGHALQVVGNLLLVIGLPAVAGSLATRLGTRLRWPAAVGYAALTARFALSAGSHLYYLWTLPLLASYPQVRPELSSGPLASIYSGHNDLINVVLAVAAVGLVVTLWLSPGRLRSAAVVLAVALACQAMTNPLALLLYAVLAIWLGLRIALRGSVATPLRSPR